MGEDEALVDLLGRERMLLEVLVYRLVELRSLLASSCRMEGRFLAWAAEEVEDATAAVRGAELNRALLISRVAEQRGCLDESLTMAVLIDAADPPWHALLADHRRALVVLTGEVDDHASAVRRLARTEINLLADQLAHLPELFEASEDNPLLLRRAAVLCAGEEWIRLGGLLPSLRLRLSFVAEAIAATAVGLSRLQRSDPQHLTLASTAPCVDAQLVADEDAVHQELRRRAALAGAGSAYAAADGVFLPSLSDFLR